MMAFFYTMCLLKGVGYRAILIRSCYICIFFEISIEGETV